MELDKENKIIFEHLLAFARFSVKDLAHVLKVSKATVLKRLKFLEDEKYILRYDAIINWQRLHFIKKVYFVKVSKKEKEFENKIIKNKSVFSVISLSGLYNSQVWCFFKNEKQKKEFENELREEYLDVEVKELIFPKVSFFDIPLKLKIPKIQNVERSLTNIDISIMKYMAQGHGRDSWYQISTELNLPYDSVNYHGKNLLNSGYFLAIVAQPGTNKLTLQTTCLVVNFKNNQSALKLFNSLKETPYIMSNSICKNNTLMIHFLSQTHTSYRETLSKILSLTPREEIKNLMICHWDKVILNNRYPLDYLISS